MDTPALQNERGSAEFNVGIVHWVNLVLLLVLLGGTAYGYAHVAPELFAKWKPRLAWDLWPTQPVHYWFRPAIYFLAITVIAYFGGIVSSRSQDDRSPGIFVAAGVTLFAANMVQLSCYFTLHGQERASGVAVLVMILTAVIAGIVLVRAGYGNGLD